MNTSLRATVILSFLLLTGCVSQHDASVNPAKANEVMFAAMQQVGKPYRYGGSSPTTGFDCSGLVDYVFQESIGMKHLGTRFGIATIFMISNCFHYVVPRIEVLMCLCEAGQIGIEIITKAIIPFDDDAVGLSGSDGGRAFCFWERDFSRSYLQSYLRNTQSFNTGNK